jgi:hypothetical protein
MSVTAPSEQEVGVGSTAERIVNDFAIQVQPSTALAARPQTLSSFVPFSDGVPVSGKNMFPSNIAGLPTWYNRARQREVTSRGRRKWTFCRVERRDRQRRV